ncbi:YezD family protein [Lysinibacillus piscis]|uniref:DUF2292 domain-containing protein n=1 Tax=Lysinibacillus piscis TaxID=2518931 RepID=A0ABQ5NF27_9BACI|nr:YezD family protein [Lysinibacillus sp. KH24]GLC86897.1 hypothetical protein LYSBPC_00240 [Lysinibacillus sp. KH24]
MEQQEHVSEQQLEAVAQAIQQIAFGEVQITIQDGAIVQVNKLEKQRFSQQKKDHK